MRSSSESGYEARVANAEKLVSALKSFDNHQSLDIEKFNALVVSVKEINNTIALKKQNYSLAVENRKHIFTKRENAIRKLLSPIGTIIRTSFGRTSEEARNVTDIISKIRGTNRAYNVSNGSIENNINQSYRSYNSQTQFFSDLIAYLETLGKTYIPSNSDLHIDALKEILNEAINANNIVMMAYNEFTKARDARLAAYAELSETAQRIKVSVNSLYGNSVAENRLVKNLKI